jgi:hypothetical protein
MVHIDPMAKAPRRLLAVPGEPRPAPPGKETEVPQAGFSHDETGKADRKDRFMGVEHGEFFLSHGGFKEGYTEFGEPFERPATGKPPADLSAAP